MLHYVDVQKVNKEELMRVSIGVRCVCDVCAMSDEPPCF